MATFKSTQISGGAAPSLTFPKSMVQSVFGQITISTNPTAGDIFQLVKVPANATVVGGYLRAVDLDTGVEVMDMDIGWADNGVDAADPDGFGNLGVWSGDAILDLKPEAGIFYPLGGVLFSAGPKLFTVETTIQVVANVAANAGGTGKLWAVVDYVV